MTAKDLSLILNTAADSIEAVGVDLPPALAGEMVRFIELIKTIFFPSVASAHSPEKMDAMMAELRGFDPKHLDVLIRLLKNEQEFYASGDAARTVKTCRGIARGWFLRRLAAWIVG